MGLLKQAAGLRRRLQQLWHGRDPHATSDRLRVCRVEELEPRSMLAADVPDINVGVFYYEADGGQDTAGDRFEVTFNGGAPGTQLKQLVIDTDKDGLGLSVGDAFFDTQAGGQGASLAFPFTVVDSTGITTALATVTDGGTKLILDFTGFDVGEKFIFSIDVDEKGFLENSSNAIVEGEEFEASKMFATFTAPHFHDAKTPEVNPPRFFDAFSFAGLGLSLPPDNYTPPGSTEQAPVRTAGVHAVLTPKPLPITISGTVFEDINLNNTREAGDAGIAGVSLALLELEGGVYVATGKTTITNDQGQYAFDDVLPGTYRIVETQPGGYFSVGAKAGTVNGAVVGAVTSVDVISEISLLGGQDSIHNDFAEARPAQLSGHVYHDRDDDGVRDAGEEGIGQVKVVLERLASTNPLLASSFVEVFTDASGFWEATGLRPGSYVVREVQPVGYFDGKDRAGSLGGTAVNPGDEINGVFLASGASGVNYDFGELQPVSIAGMVHTDTDFDCILDPGEIPLEGVTIHLLNAAGNRIQTTTTKADGTYEFLGLPPGVYGVEEIQPAGYFDGGDSIGSHGGTSPANDKFAGIVIASGQAATEYNFCEHPPASLAGRVFVDDNDNGLIDAGEVGIGGVTLQLLDAAGNATGVTTTTSADGSYLFTGLAPGAWGVAEVQPGGYYDGKDAAGSAGGSALNPGDRITGATLAPAAAGVQYNFGELRPTSISGRVHRDEDGDCTFDPGEQPIAGVTVYLLDASGNRIATTTTNEQGIYTFSNLKPGVYGVEEITPPGVFDGGEFVGTHGGQVVANDKVAGATLGSGAVATGYDFCEKAPVTLAGRVYIDDNDNGLVDSGEAGIGGVTLQLLDENGNATGQITTTAADGSYLFAGLRPAVYGVAELQPAGFFDGKDTAGNAGGAAVNPGDRITGAVLSGGLHGKEYNFGELRPAGIRGRVHADTDNDCTYDPDFEQPIAGVTIQLLDAAGNIIATTQTAADGTYQFTGLKPGVYGVRELQPAGFFNGGTVVGSAGGTVVVKDHVAEIALGSGVAAVDYNFCEKPPASLSGRVHADTDGDCEFDPGEQPIAGVTIYLLDASGTRIASTQTNAKGEYLFSGLEPNKVYGVEEIQPAGYFDGGEDAGSAGGVESNDKITEVLLGAGVNAVGYNFCEKPPASLSGRVHADTDGDCELDPGEQPIAGVTIYLLDAAGNRIASTKTDVNGLYSFSNLKPDTVYGVEEIQPDDFFDGGQDAGSAGGVETNDRITEILLKPGVDATDYNFCEKPPAQLSGRVYFDLNNNGADDGEPGIPNVTLRLLDENGNELNATVTTDAEGNYVFTGLKPGVYGVRETQPAGYFDGLDSAGSAGGVAQNPGDEITGATLKPLEHGKNYDFGELPGGVISGYVFRDGPAIPLDFGQTTAQVNIEQVRPGARGASDLPISGVTLALGDASGNLLKAANGNLITAVTDANGYYRFTGLTPGAYTVFEQHPTGYTDGVDTPGSTGGTAANASNLFAPVLVNVSHRNDAIVGIRVQAGTESVENNFSEVVFAPPPPLIPPPERRVPPPPTNSPAGAVPTPRLVPFSPVPPILPLGYTAYYGGGVGGAERYSWHLSVIDAGNPRGELRRAGELMQVSEARFDVFQAVGVEMTESKFMLKQEGQPDPRVLIFGMEGATPISGDFDGDGRSEIGVFHRGQWYIDINGNGIWDAEDLWAELGGPADLPITGDWDGDGKTDIGIFGPKWTNDERAVQREPGLPDADNEPTGKYKNIPPKPQDAAVGVRKLKKTSQGRLRADLVDHVFFYGSEKDTPLAGDWNGDGIATIGIFRDGLWILDDNGDGQWLPGESMAEFGQEGDLPVVGDFNGDGIDELAIYRGGVWHIDINNNRKHDAEDLIIEHGGPNDRPVVGDWDGDGRDEVGLYQDGQALREKG